MKIHKIYALLLCFFSLMRVSVGQSCYVELEDASGFHTGIYQQELADSACSLVQTFPVEYQNQFKVYDFGFYLHQEHYEGSFPQVFADKVAEAGQLSPYYLLFGRQTDPNGVFTKIWVAVRLPQSGIFMCLDDNKLTGLETELERVLNDGLDTPHVYPQNEINAMERLKVFIQRLSVCCFSGGSRQFTSIDSSLLEIQVFIDNCEEEEEGTIALVGPGPFMPEISFMLEYFGDTLCTSLKAILKISYEREPSAATELKRNDITLDTITPVELGFPYVFDFGEVSLWGLNWTQIQGGRAELIIVDGFEVPVKSFKFTIKGQNPRVADVFAYLEEEPYNELWFLKKLFMHESGTDASLGMGAEMEQFNPYDPAEENLQEDWNAFSRCPKLSDNQDGGWGLGQLTLPMPNKQSLWDWKANVHEAYHRLAEGPVAGENGTKYSAVKSKLEGFLSTVETWEANNPGLEVAGHEDFMHGGLTWVHGMSDIMNGIDGLEDHFTEDIDEGERSFIEAMLMKAYNGIGTTGSPHFDNHFYYLYYDNESSEQVPEWRIDVDAHYEDDVNRYVEAVSETVVPSE